MGTIIQTIDLSKDFGQQKGVFEANLSVSKGEVVGFIGPNGAGKTTTISTVLGLIKATSGQVKLFGEAIEVNTAYKFMPKIGIMLSDVAFEPSFTAQQILKRNANLLHLKLDEKIQTLASELDLDLETKFANLSFGNKRKVAIINALMHEPELLVLDEPTSGLDPLIQQKFLEYIKQAKLRGAGIFLSSHVLSEVQAICDRILMIKKGHIILAGLTKEILKDASKIIRLQAPNLNLVEGLKSLKQIDKLETLNEQITLSTKDPEPIIKYLVAKDFYDFYIEKPNLEDMFVEYYKD